DFSADLLLDHCATSFGTIGCCWRTAHSYGRNDVRGACASSTFGLRRPRPLEHQPRFPDRAEKPVPHIGLTMAEDDGHNTRVGDDALGLTEGDRQRLVEMRAIAMVVGLRIFRAELLENHLFRL